MAPASPAFVPPRDIFRGRPWMLLNIVTDAMLLWVALALAGRVELDGPVPSTGIELGGVLTLGALLSLGSRGLYDVRTARTSALDEIKDVVFAHGTGVIAALAVAALVHPGGGTNAMLLLAGVFGAALILPFRALLTSARRRARRAGRSGRRVLIVGAGTTSAELEKRLLERPELGLHPVGFLDECPSPGFRDRAPQTPVLGAPADLARVSRATGASHVIFAYGSTWDRDLPPLVREAQRLGLRVSIVPRLFEAVGQRTHVDHVGGIPLLVTRQTLPNAWPFLVKHTLGRAIALGVAMAGLPLLGALALAVRVSSPGPVLFRQRRVGRDGRVFDILKFRTMRIADPLQAVAAAGPVAPGAGPGGVEGVDRRTAIGTFLRRTSLDELPQLLNVVQGHMTLVGPRPERPEWVARFGGDVRGYDDRHRVKSGMTGWAQVHGLRGQTSISDRIELDNWYVQNWSLWLDVKILMLTPIEVIRSRAEAATGLTTPEKTEPAEVAEAIELIEELEARPDVRVAPHLEAERALDQHVF